MDARRRGQAGQRWTAYLCVCALPNRDPPIATFPLAARQGLSADQVWEWIKERRPAAHYFEKAVYRDACLRALEMYGDGDPH